MDKNKIIKILNVTTLIAGVGLTFVNDYVEKERQNEKIASEVEKQLKKALEES